MATDGKALPRQLGLFSATMILVGTVIGAGIFITPGTVAQAAKSPGPDLLAWVIAGVAATLFALVYSELAPMLPRAGGAYVYMQEAFGDAAAFLYGWAMIFGSYLPVMALLAIAFTTYLSYFIHGLDQATSRVIASALIIILGLVNIRGVKQGALVQNVFTVGKLAALGLVIVGGIITLKLANFSPFVGPEGWSGTFKAAVPAILAFGGYYTLAYMSEEVKDPKRTLPLAMILGMGIVIVVNLLLNVAALGTVPMTSLAGSQRPVATVALAIFGPIGGALVAFGALVSIFGSANSSTMGLPRVAFAMARDKMLFGLFAKVHPKYGTPYVSIAIYCLVALFFIWTGTFITLLLMGIFVARFLECIVAISLIVLRHKRPDLDRPVKMWGYPITTVLTVLITGYLITLVDPVQIRNGALLMISSIPAYFIFKYLVPQSPSTPKVVEA